MEQPTASPNQPFPAYPTTSADSLACSWAQAENLQLCTPTTISHHGHGESFVPSNQIHLRHFDIYQCAQPYNTTVTTSVSPPAASVDLDFGLLIPQYNSPSPTQKVDSMYPHSQGKSDSSELSAIKYPQRKSRGDQKPSSKGMKIKRHVQRRAANRPSPIFPSCSTPISMIGQHNPPNSTAQQIMPKSTGDFLNLKLELGASNLTKKSLSVSMHHQSLQQLKDIEIKILKLQAERGRLLKTAHERSHLSEACVCPLKREETLNLYLSSVEQLREVENGLIEDGNTLMFKIGSLYSSLDRAVEKCISLCSSGHSSISCIADCFPYVNSLVSATKGTKVKLLEHSDTKFIQLECSPSKQSSSPDSLHIVFNALNDIMYHAQLIQHHGKETATMLQTLQSRIQHILANLGEILQDCSLESQACIQAVVEGNISVLSAVQQVWEKCCQFGADSVATITHSLTNCQ